MGTVLSKERPRSDTDADRVNGTAIRATRHMVAIWATLGPWKLKFLFARYATMAKRNPLAIRACKMLRRSAKTLMEMRLVTPRYRPYRANDPMNNGMTARSNR